MMIARYGCGLGSENDKSDGDGRLLGQEEEDGGGDLQCGGRRW